MKRREFIVTSCFAVSFSFVKAESKTFDELPWVVIDRVFDILFPKTDTMPSAKEFNATIYLKQNSTSKYFDKDDLEYLLQGAKDFLGTFEEFLKVDIKKQEQYIKDANSSEYGQSWLSLLVYYGVEAMLSDPIYGGNANEIGWKSLNHKTGKPQPKYQYAKVV